MASQLGFRPESISAAPSPRIILSGHGTPSVGTHGSDEDQWSSEGYFPVRLIVIIGCRAETIDQDEYTTRSQHPKGLAKRG